MPRWTPQEHAEIDTVRLRLADLLMDAPPFPEVIGDRKIIRYLRGHDHNIEKVCDLYGKFLRWRKTANVDEIRRNIVERGMDHPLKFPKGELIQSLMPALIIAPDAQDILGSPVVLDQYNFSPQDLLNNFTLEDYILYATYCLEYRQIILEQISEERESAFLSTLTDEEKADIDRLESDKPPYGVIAQSCVIRDLNGVGFEHLSAKGQEIIRAVIALASDNYPELMRKAFMVNTPWIFNTVWFFIKGLLAARTVAKISIMGTTFMDEIEKEIPRENIPALIGGPYIGYQKYVPYAFDKTYLCPWGDESQPSEDTPLQEEVQETSELLIIEEATIVVTSVEESSSTPETPVGDAVVMRSHEQVAVEIDISLITLQTSG